MKEKWVREMDDYKFSVLMSVYYKENPEYFSMALKSNLQEQTLTPNEMVLVCDGPLTDALERVVEQYQSAFPHVLKVYRLERNEGLGKALNYGLEKCQYTWVARSDSDDICASNRFETQIEFLKNHRNVDILSSYIYEFDNDWMKPCRKKSLPLSHEEIVEMAKFRNPINHMAVMFRKDVVLQAGSYQHLAYVEDYFLWVRAICNGAQLANIDQGLVYARIGNGMVKRRSNSVYIDSWKVLNQYMRERKMIHYFTYYKNMLTVRIFIYTPTWIKDVIYKYLLRTKG